MAKKQDVSPEERAVPQIEADSIQIVIGDSASHVAIGKNISQKAFGSSENRSLLRQWWHDILRDHGSYSCYAFLLALPSDKRAIRFFAEYGRELHLLSGKNCLIIALSDTQFMSSGFSDEMWEVMIDEQVSEGHSIEVAQLFGIKLTELPCIVLFQDIRTPEHVVVTLKGMKTKEISDQVRSLFSIVHQAASDRENPLSAIEQYRDQEKFRRAGQTIISHVRGLGGRTFEAAMEAWMKANIK